MMPNPPTDLKVEALSGGAHLTWKDNSDNESAFMIERMVGSAADMPKGDPGSVTGEDLRRILAWTDAFTAAHAPPAWHAH